LSALDYLADLRASFERAVASSGGPVECRLRMAGVALRLRSAGPALAERLFPPFEHLRGGEAGAAELTINLFDTKSSGVEPPSLPWPLPEAAPGTNPVVRSDTGRVCLLAAAGSGALTVGDRARGEAVFHVSGAGSVPQSEGAAPLRDAIDALMEPRGRWLTHAAAVGRGSRGALLVGASGSGKSTLALSCALSGMEIAADDYVLLELGPPVAHAMQSTAKLTADSAELLGLDPGVVDGDGFEPTLEGPAKALVDIRALAPSLLRDRLRVAALIAPQVAGASRPELSPIPRPAALRRLAPSTVLQSGPAAPKLLGALAQLTREVPAYELRLSPDPEANAAAVAGLLGGELG
jgi:hypothetical protein